MIHTNDPHYFYYLEQYKELHKDSKKFPGDSLLLNIKFIVPLIDSTQTKSLLDYGCGKGLQYTLDKLHEKHFNGIMPTLYDPAVSKYSEYPTGVFDGVICTDVLEHIPESSVDFVLADIGSKATKFVHLSISTIDSIAVLPNGQKAHITVKPVSWWIDKILPHTKNNVIWNAVFRGALGDTSQTANVTLNNGSVTHIISGRVN